MAKNGIWCWWLVIILAACTVDNYMVDWYEINKQADEFLTETIYPEARRVCQETWTRKQTVADTMHLDGFYVVTHRVKNGPDAGYWHNPVGGYAVEFYTDNGVMFIQKSYAVQVSTDVVQKIKGNQVVYPAEVRYYYEQGFKRVTRKLNSWENDNDGPAIVEVSLSTGDTISTRCFNCDLQVPCD